MQMRLISWNVRQGGGKRVPAQVAALAERSPDIVALQEVRVGSAPLYRDALAASGLPYCTDSFQLALDALAHVGGKRDGLLIASRWPVTALPPTDFTIPYHERVLSAVIDTPSGSIEVHNAHVPNGTNHAWIKIETFEGIYKRLVQPAQLPRILCGDFNSPKMELPDGRVMVWSERLAGDRVVTEKSIRDPEGRWALGEHLVMTGLAAYDLPDVFRAIHGYDKVDFSFQTVRQGKSFPRRFDHIFASRSLRPAACQYLHSLRENGLSDHSPMEADFDA